MGDKKKSRPTIRALIDQPEPDAVSDAAAAKVHVETTDRVW